MPEFEVLCVTMRQKDFSKIKQMNVRSNIVYANQCDRTAYEEICFDGHIAKMISTETRGVGKNRNIALLYASADICLMADDDVVYCDDMEEKVLSEFAAHPDADVMIFHLDTNSDRKQICYPKTRKCTGVFRMPWGAFRIAFRRDSVRKANLWFSTLFGGGCIFPCGEDSLWLTEARRKGLTFYVSKETIGSVSHEESTWFTGFDEKYYFGQGALYQAMRPKSFFVWLCYSAWRTRKHKELHIAEKLRWMKLGREGYQKMKGFSDYSK